MTGLGSYMRGVALFVSGIVVGTVVMQPSAAQENRSAGLWLNHVGIAVKDYQQSVDFYTKVMGFRKAFGGEPGPDGKPGTIYLQISRDSFIEVAQATDNMPAGITHLGLQVQDEDGLVSTLRQRGATATDPRVSQGLSKSKLANVTDPNGIRLELSEAIPGSVLRQVEESWK
jgi:catechol 2,3-dioxygenase-like lactoylglutathione lyase family enzyme